MHTISALAAILVLGSSTLLPSQKWIRNPSNGHDYALTAKMTWKQAEAQAINWGGHLVTIRSKAENDWLLTTFSPGGEGAWIGFTDEAKEGTWVWVSGEKSAYTNWCSGQPDNSSGDEDFGVFECGGRGWNDLCPKNCRLAPGIVERRRPPATFSTFGSGCAGSATPPSIQSSSPPRIGTTFTVQVTSINSPTGGVLIFGASDKTWSGSPLPMDLRFMGMGGCKLLVSWDAEIAFFLRTGSTWSWKASIPNNASFIGTTFFNQAWVLDSKANPLGIATSNGGRGVIGF